MNQPLTTNDDVLTNLNILLAEQLNSAAKLTATEFLELLGDGNISVTEYAAACADISDEVENKVNAWTWYDRARFEESARKLDAKLSAYRNGSKNNSKLPGLLYGVPTGVKDIFNTTDMPTEHGSRCFENYMPGNDARVVTNLRRQSAIMAGKTVTAEFAVHQPGATRNPRDLGRSCGTSSSGSAAAVATGMVPIALASQTAGSTIRPASYCGIYGFKPSYGLIPRTAMLKTTDTLDSVAFMARSVDDIRLMFEIEHVIGPNYPIVDKALGNPSRRSKGNRAWRVGVLQGPKSGLESRQVKNGIFQLTDALQRDGCDVAEIQLPEQFEEAYSTHELIYRKCLSYYFRMEWEKDRTLFSEKLSSMIDAGLSIPPSDYYAALKKQTVLANQFDRLMQDYDAVICPSTADEAPVGLATPDPDDHCLIFTMCYAPSMSVPILKGSSGLPVGAQIVSRRYNDYLLLEFADYLNSLAFTPS
jgi:Asp-tRNA(Asn)/Glu-tRNA(Gln) amidotransferase A subunit family amidase